jgi:hypothetical protein
MKEKVNRKGTWEEISKRKDRKKERERERVVQCILSVTIFHLQAAV